MTRLTRAESQAQTRQRLVDVADLAAWYSSIKVTARMPQ